MDYEEEVLEPPTDGKDLSGSSCLIVRCTHNIQVMDDSDKQRTNIFHSRCLNKEKLCSLIIDSGSCANVSLQPNLLRNCWLKFFTL
ncbi:hypothetical protein J1N35_028050 [Gossypium stocksii]|uniref:Uncharacterized protein n=1 Tax=Gossypium stocksii TaxID=47602 RepID=A0A9D3UVF9_9ROSI|nr:hypothetical protein J1N35_028050 [Gossypium stocksii]